MPSLFDFWRKKDRVDQILHGGIGFLVSLVPCVIVMINVKDISTKYLLVIAISSYLGILLIAILREKRQHMRWVFNLDSLFWLVGATAGVVSALSIIILTSEV